MSCILYTSVYLCILVGNTIKSIYNINQYIYYVSSLQSNPYINFRGIFLRKNKQLPRFLLTWPNFWWLRTHDDPSGCCNVFVAAMKQGAWNITKVNTSSFIPHGAQLLGPLEHGKGRSLIRDIEQFPGKHAGALWLVLLLAWPNFPKSSCFKQHPMACARHHNFSNQIFGALSHLRSDLQKKASPNEIDLTSMVHKWWAFMIPS